MMKQEVFERRCSELKERQAIKQDCDVVRLPPQSASRTYSLRQAAQRLGVSYSTARRLLATDPDVRRYSTATGEPVFPGTPLKRFQCVRLTWVIPESAIQRLILKMQGQQPAAA
jgi:hypothetical protein